ncbi:hypothetical protein [Clostridium sp. C2-6-12]|uniref:hypothetical protein n=1 Tax=Clostridium sp. C2-6-12 TaxID=2698832 RepID=UPI0013703107|nr:hypothetical protein [Clostridium sp. C2-6-12]
MRNIAKTSLLFLVFALSASLVSGCSKTNEIRVSEDVKKEVLLKVEDNKPKNTPVLKKKLSGLENKRVLFWIDEENILVIDREDSKLRGENLILYSYNIESDESTEILNDSNITRLYDFPYNRTDGLILVGNKKQAFVFDSKERKLEEVLDLDKEFVNGLPGSKKAKEKQDLWDYNVQLIKQGYISYVSKLENYNKYGLADKAEYTILNYNDHKKYTLNESYSKRGIDSKFDLTGKNIYIGEFAKLIKLNLETGEKSSMDLSMPRIQNVFEDGTLFVYCTEENGTRHDKFRLYKVDFDKKVVSRYEENYEGKNLSINWIDFKNEFVCYTYFGDGDDRGKNIAMYGKMQGNKFIVTDKLFKNNEEAAERRQPREYVFSPNHNKFITSVVDCKTNIKSDEEVETTYLTDDKYLFQLE